MKSNESRASKPGAIEYGKVSQTYESQSRSEAPTFNGCDTAVTLVGPHSEQDACARNVKVSFALFMCCPIEHLHSMLLRQFTDGAYLNLLVSPSGTRASSMWANS